MTTKDHAPPTATWKKEDDAVILALAGDWLSDGPVVKIHGTRPKQVPDRYETEQLGNFDSILPSFLLAHIRACGAAPLPDSKGKPDKIQPPPLQGLPDNLKGLMELALAVPEQSETKNTEDTSFLARTGRVTIRAWQSAIAVADFTGQSVLSFNRFFLGRARFRPRDFWLIVQQCGAQALPIVALISFLIGLILAFVGSHQLAHFGADIFIADLVGIAMVREMGIVMTAIIVSGRTGAAFAAQLGSMQANEEIDALRTFGFNPFDFLVLPRIIALVLMLPLLTIFANVVGIFGGFLVGIALGIPAIVYYQQTLDAITLTNASLGVIKSVFIGAAIAMCGCMQGMNAGKSSAAVGHATTKAVVAAITAIIIIDSIFAAIFTLLGI